MAQNDVITLTSGDDDILRFTVRGEDGTPLDDISGFEFAWALFAEGAAPGDYTIIKDTAANGGIAIAAPLEAEVAIDLQRSDTEPLKGAYAFQMRGVSPEGARQMVAEGPVIVEEDKLLLP